MPGAEGQQGIKSDRALGFSLLFKILYENSHYCQYPIRTALTYEDTFCVIRKMLCFMKNSDIPTGCGGGALETTWIFSHFKLFYSKAGVNRLVFSASLANKILLEHSCTHSFTYHRSLLLCYRGKSCTCDKILWCSKKKYLLSSPFQKKAVNPSSREKSLYSCSSKSWLSKQANNMLYFTLFSLQWNVLSSAVPSDKTYPIIAFE